MTFTSNAEPGRLGARICVTNKYKRYQSHQVKSLQAGAPPGAGQTRYSLDSPLRSQDPRGGSDFLAPSRPRGRFLAFGGPFLRSVAAQKVSYRVRHFGRVFTFPLSGATPNFIVCVTVLAARSARFFRELSRKCEAETPKFSRGRGTPAPWVVS